MPEVDTLELLGVPLYDALRFVVLAEAFVILGVTASIVQRYYMVKRHAPGGLGLLPSHVWMIGTSYILLVGALAYDVGDLLDEKPQLDDLPIALVSMTFGLIALLKILRYEQHRYHGARMIELADPRTRDDAPPDGLDRRKP